MQSSESGWDFERLYFGFFYVVEAVEEFSGYAVSTDEVKSLHLMVHCTSTLSSTVQREEAVENSQRRCLVRQRSDRHSTRQPLQNPRLRHEN